jgi:hypothetical protein
MTAPDHETMPCEQCGERFENLAMHWKKSQTCLPPPLQADTKAHILGALLGGAHIREGPTGNRFLEYNTSSEALAKWLAEQLGHLGKYGTVYEYEQSHRVRTISHPELSGYEALLTTDGCTLPTEIATDETEWIHTEDAGTFTLSPAIARVWYTLSGSRYEGASTPIPRLRRGSIDATAEDWQSLLGQFSPRVYERQVRLSDGVAWFDFIGWDPESPATKQWLTNAELTTGTQCPDCNQFFEQIKYHWSQTDCSPPEE